MDCKCGVLAFYFEIILMLGLSCFKTRDFNNINSQYEKSTSALQNHSHVFSPAIQSSYIVIKCQLFSNKMVYSSEFHIKIDLYVLNHLFLKRYLNVCNIKGALSYIFYLKTSIFWHYILLFKSYINLNIGSFTYRRSNESILVFIR